MYLETSRITGKDGSLYRIRFEREKKGKEEKGHRDYCSRGS